MATKKTKSVANSQGSESRWSVYDEHGDVSQGANEVYAEIFVEYASYTPREEMCRKLVFDQAEEEMTKAQFAQLCRDIKDFDMQEEGELADDERAA